MIAALAPRDLQKNNADRPVWHGFCMYPQHNKAVP